MTPPPPPYSESPSQVLEPQFPATAASLKTLITRRDAVFASFIVKFLLRNFESLKFVTPQPLGWTYATVLPKDEALVDYRK